MILFDNRVGESGAKIDDGILELLESIACSVTNRDIELLIVSNDEIRALNAEFLGKDYATDVLSFPLDSSEFTPKVRESSAESTADLPHQTPNLPLGSIVIALEIAECIADSQNHSLQTELAILFTHGLLHLLGYDHESDSGEHRVREREILARFGIKSALIERSLQDSQE